MKYLSNVSTLKLNLHKCSGCGMCLKVCPHEVFAVRNRKAVIVDLDSCMECGACKINCSFGALEVKSGVGCAAGIMLGALRGTEATCNCK
ncbi:MAG: ferredoxin [Candidatus Firestonebacteria bacterium RIFOXYC2_FULL_39_67]|nr:MAG: ferredoxin [Candidatus Firestonebacteria bacterium RIFOXYD2_FULL_39_29]OGF54399.1 MAG: ferredoxin [Candidatus Firestonebacteria bacterium RIFOXYC2_FULL_39_67]